jgi:hypothetical protein
MHMKRVQIGDRTCLVHQFKTKVVLNSRLDLKSNSTISSWIVSPPWRAHVTPRSTSTVAFTVFIQWWLQYEPNSMKMVFSTNGVGSF